MKPKDVTASNADQLKRIYQSRPIPIPTSEPKLKVGDYVRVSKDKHAFEKRYYTEFYRGILRRGCSETNEPNHLPTQGLARS